MASVNYSIPFFKPIRRDNDDHKDNHETPTYLHYDDNHHHNHHRPYEPNGKVMLTAIISLSVVVLFVLALHIFARCILRRNSSHRRRTETTQHRLSFSLANPLPPPPDGKTGLDAAAIAALPISAFKPTSSSSGGGGDDDCSVCLGVLAEGELVRLLPSCSHVFHVACVDVWLGTQPTCPVCRAEVQSPPLPPPPPPPPPPAAAEGPSAPPLNSSECSESNKALSSSSRLSSFRRILSRERSSRRAVQPSLGQDQDFADDLERQYSFLN